MHVSEQLRNGMQGPVVQADVLPATDEDGANEAAGSRPSTPCDTCSPCPCSLDPYPYPCRALLQVPSTGCNSFSQFILTIHPHGCNNLRIDNKSIIILGIYLIYMCVSSLP